VNPEIQKNLPFNLTVNLLDGAFFGFALGFASFVTIIPLFVSKMTDSAILIGLVPAIHAVGWQLPQVLMANRVSRQARFKPMVVSMTIQERLPFLGLAIVAWFLPQMSNQTALILTFSLLIWQGLGGGFTAAAWQSMIGKIIPGDRRGTFYGAQSAAANLLASLSAILAGIILARIIDPNDFALCFFLAFLCMGISWVFLAQTREPATPQLAQERDRSEFWGRIRELLHQDHNFRWFLVVRIISQLAVMGFAFYAVYVVNEKGATEIDVGLMTGVFLATQIIANPLMGWLGDRFGHRLLMELGCVAAVLSSVTAVFAPSAAWFYLVFILAGIANVAVWTLALAMILEFGSEADRPAYIGMGNSFVAPMTILAPIFAGWVVDTFSYQASFFAAAIAGVATMAVLHWLVKDPGKHRTSGTEIPVLLDTQSGDNP